MDTNYFDARFELMAQQNAAVGELSVAFCDANGLLFLMGATGSCCDHVVDNVVDGRRSVEGYLITYNC